MSAFFGVIKMVCSVGKRFLDENPLNAFKILMGLAIMRYNGQMHKWLHDEEGMKGQSDTTSLFRSSINLFSWWTIFAGVEHFLGAFESDVVYQYVEASWYLNLCESECGTTANLTIVDNMTCAASSQLQHTTDSFLLQSVCLLLDDDNEVPGRFANSTIANNMTCGASSQLNRTMGGFLARSVCMLLDDDYEVAGSFFYFVVFAASALSLLYVFSNNFLKGCDT